MARKPAWRGLMDGFAKHRYTMNAAIMDDLERLDDDTLKRTLAACELPTQTNCDWATYDVAPVVRELAREVLARRTTEEDRP